ncbi:amidohydrolase [bacterium]|nr:amidohydrolase [bacterium]
MNRSWFLPLLVSLACGCGSSSSTNSLGSSPPTPDAGLIVKRQDVAALVTDVIANGNIGFLSPLQTPVQGALPWVNSDSPNASALSLGLSLTAGALSQGPGRLGGSLQIDGTAARFQQYRVPGGRLDGSLSWSPGEQPQSWLLRFSSLTLSTPNTVLTYTGTARLTSKDQEIVWNSNLKVSQPLRILGNTGTATESVECQNLVSSLRWNGDAATVTMNGGMVLQNKYSLTGNLQVRTDLPLQFHPGRDGRMRVDAGQLTLGSQQPVTVSAAGFDTNLLNLSQGGSLVKPASWNYLGGTDLKEQAPRPLVADQVLHNAQVITLNDAQPRAQAVAVMDGRILRVGDEASVTALAGPETELVDLKGKTLLPGFIEPHMHYDNTSLQLSASPQVNADGPIPANPLLLNLGLYQTQNPALQQRSKAEVLQLLSQRLAANPQAPALFGFNFDPSRLVAADLFSNLTLADLDQLSTTVPILVQNASGHISYANSAAFRLSGVWPSAPNAPYAGTDPDIVTSGGLPTGQINEEAQQEFLKTVLSRALLLQPGGIANLYRNYRTMQEQLALQGVTSGVDILMGHSTQSSLDVEAAYTAYLESREDCPTRALVYVDGLTPSDSINVFAGEGNLRLRFLGVKFITDGSTQGFTAALNFDYLLPAGFVFPAGARGLLNFPDSLALLLKVLPFYQRGFQLVFHANGDRSFDVITGMLALLPTDIKQRRTRIEHFTVHADAAELAAHVQSCLDWGLYPGHTIGHVFYWGQVFREQILGSRADHIDPVKPLLDAGVRVSLHSDSPITPVNPLLYVQIASTRLPQAPPGGVPTVLGPANTVSVLDALKCVTLYPAQAAFVDGDLGSLEEGKQGDFVVLDQDPTAIDVVANPGAIAQIKVWQTRLAGRLVSGSNP